MYCYIANAKLTLLRTFKDFLLWTNDVDVLTCNYFELEECFSIVELLKAITLFIFLYLLKEVYWLPKVNFGFLVSFINLTSFSPVSLHAFLQ